MDQTLHNLQAAGDHEPGAQYVKRQVGHAPGGQKAERRSSPQAGPGQEVFQGGKLPFGCPVEEPNRNQQQERRQGIERLHGKPQKQKEHGRRVNQEKGRRRRGVQGGKLQPAYAPSQIHAAQGGEHQRDHIGQKILGEIAPVIVNGHGRGQREQKPRSFDQARGRIVPGHSQRREFGQQQADGQKHRQPAQGQ